MEAPIGDVANPHEYGVEAWWELPTDDKNEVPTARGGI